MIVLKRFTLVAAVICHLLLAVFTLLKATKLARPIINGKFSSVTILSVKEKKALSYMLVCDLVLFYFTSFINEIIVEGETIARSLLYSVAFVVNFVKAFPNGLVFAWVLLLFIMHRSIDREFIRKDADAQDKEGTSTGDGK